MRSLKDGSWLYLLLYVDDMLIACKSKKVVQELKGALSREFEMKDLGSAKKVPRNHQRQNQEATVSILGRIYQEGLGEIWNEEDQPFKDLTYTCGS